VPALQHSFTFRSGDTTFNSLPSNRHADLTPALAFVNYFCEVASLEPDIVPDIINVKRQVLSMLQVKEFSPIARFENPAPKLILPAVFCPLCSHGQDIDLCRDHGALSKNWKCVTGLLFAFDLGNMMQIE
jgi:DNA polymerase epsilon subunit 1